MTLNPIRFNLQLLKLMKTNSKIPNFTQAWTCNNLNITLQQNIIKQQSTLHTGLLRPVVTIQPSVHITVEKCATATSLHD